jgi:hypothetical protein
LEIRTAENGRNWDDTLPENFPFSINVRQKHVKRPNALLKPADDLVPIVTGEYLGQQITEPGVVTVP